LAAWANLPVAEIVDEAEAEADIARNAKTKMRTVHRQKSDFGRGREFRLLFFQGCIYLLARIFPNASPP
jgi:hypothetical protein